jgi:hypothetical protein
VLPVPDLGPPGDGRGLPSPAPCLRRRDLGWAIVAINQIGSILFAISALGAFIRPETSSPVNVAIANWGTLTGALCFAIGGVMQGFERPAR